MGSVGFLETFPILLRSFLFVSSWFAILRVLDRKDEVFFRLRTMLATKSVEDEGRRVFRSVNLMFCFSFFHFTGDNAMLSCSLEDEMRWRIEMCNVFLNTS